MNEQSPQGTALAGAMTARADDASAIFYNPAGLAFQSGISALAGVTFLTAQSSLTQTVSGTDPTTGAATSTSSTYSSLRGNFYLPTLYLAARLHDKVSVGVGGFTSYGLTVDWRNPSDPAPFPGRYLTEKAALQTFTVNPTVALRICSAFSLAVGLDVVIGSVELIRALNFGSADGAIDVSAGAVGVGANVGGMLRLFHGLLSVGLSYRSSTNLAFYNGQVGYTPPAGVSLPAFPYTTGQTQIGLPHTIAAGLAVRPLHWLTVSADFNATLWSKTQPQGQQVITLSDASGQNTQQSATARNWNDAFAGRLGVELDISRMMDKEMRFIPKIRAGFGYDQSPIPSSTLDPSLPDANRYLASGGLSLGYRGLGSVDLGYEAVILGARTATNPDLRVTYNSNVAHIVSAALVFNYEGILSHRKKGYGGLSE